MKNNSFCNARCSIAIFLAIVALGCTATCRVSLVVRLTTYYRKLVRMKDLDLRDIIHNFLDSSDYAYREVEIRELNNDMGAELKDALWKTLKHFIVDRGIGTQVNVDSTSFTNSVQIYAGVAADSVDIFRIQFTSQRSTTTNEIDRKYLQQTGETRFSQKTTNFTITYDIIGINAYDAMQQTFVAGEYKDMTCRRRVAKSNSSPPSICPLSTCTEDSAILAIKSSLIRTNGFSITISSMGFTASSRRTIRSINGTHN